MIKTAAYVVVAMLLGAGTAHAADRCVKRVRVGSCLILDRTTRSDYSEYFWQATVDVKEKETSAPQYNKSQCSAEDSKTKKLEEAAEKACLEKHGRWGLEWQS